MGCFVQPPDFTHDRYWRELGVYIGKVGKVTPRGWTEILNAVGSDDEKLKVPEHVGISTISAYRENLYIPITPVKSY